MNDGQTKYRDEPLLFTLTKTSGEVYALLDGKFQIWKQIDDSEVASIEKMRIKMNINPLDASGNRRAPSIIKHLIAMM